MMTVKGKNLLVIISDEHRKDAMGNAGHPHVKTPNLDALAARGTVFENAYTPSPNVRSDPGESGLRRPRSQNPPLGQRHPI